MTEGIYTAHVEVTHKVETKYSTEEADTHAYPQYAVTAIKQQTKAQANVLSLTGVEAVIGVCG